MADGLPWVEFDAPLEVLPWGRNVYTIIRLPPAIETASKLAGTRRVEGSIDGVAVNVGVNRADVLETACLYAGQGVQRRLDARPGDVVSCRLRPADPDEVPLADDVHRTLVDAARLVPFQRKSSAERRRLLQPIEQVARAQTRQQRIAALVRSLSPV